MENRDITVALTGNTYLAQSISRSINPGFLSLVDLLRSADVALTNLECAIPDPTDSPAFVAGAGWAATYMEGRRQMVEELKFLGFNVVCAANNHVADFGISGIMSTIRQLRDAQMPFTGIGASLTEATQPAYVDTPSGLRVAIIVACDWGPRGGLGLGFPWPSRDMPSDDAPPFRPRPGVNLLRYDVVSHVSPDQLRQLRQISKDLGWEDDKIARRNGFRIDHPLVGMVTNVGVEVDTEDQFWFFGRKYVTSDRPGHHTFACQEDVDRLCRYIREARRQADVVLVGLHDQSHGDDAPGHVKTFAHDAIDAGADVYFSNGGQLRGIEVYKSKAIIYGVPTFFLQTQAVTNVPSSGMERFGLPPYSTAADFLDAREQSRYRAFKEAIGGHERLPDLLAPTVHLCRFDHKAKLQAVEIQPLVAFGGTILHQDEQLKIPRFRRGLPMMPDAKSPVSERVVGRVLEASKQFGTPVAMRNGRGVVEINS